MKLNEACLPTLWHFFLFFFLPLTTIGQFNTGSTKAAKEATVEKVGTTLELVKAQKMGIDEKIDLFLEMMQFESLLADTSVTKSELYWYFAMLMVDLKEYEMAISYIKKSGFEKGGRKYYSKLLGCFLELNELDSALYYATEFYEVSQDVGDVVQANALNNRGFIYEKLDDKDKAWEDYQNAEKRIVAANRAHRGLHFTILENMARLYRERDDVLKAKEIYRFIAAAILEQQKNQVDYKNQGKLVNALLQNLSLELSRGNRQLNKEFEIAHFQVNRLKIDHPAELKLRLHELKAAYYKLRSNYQLACQEKEKTIAIKDSIYTSNQQAMGYVQKELTQIKISNFNKKIAGQIALTKATKEKANAYSYIAALLVLLLGFIVLMSYGFHSRKRMQHQAEIELQTIQKQLLNADLKNKALESEKLGIALEQKKKDLLSFSTYIAENRDWLNHLLVELEAINKTRKAKILKTIISNIQSRLLVDEKIKFLQENIHQINQEFAEKLAHRFPKLTPNEVEHCGFIRIGLSTKEIAILRNVTPSAVKVARHRMRKKMEIDAAENLYLFFKKL